MDLRRLFEPRGDAQQYESLMDEVAAVASGEKVVSMACFAADEIDESSLYRRMISEAHERRLLVVTEADGNSINVFVLGANELWRVPAISEMRRAFASRWSDEAEALNSSLLGYSLEQSARWLEERRVRHIGWGMRTVFALVQAENLDAIRELGMRAFPAGFPYSGGPIFAHNDQWLRLDAHKLVPAGLRIIRFGGDHRFFIKRSRSDDGEIIIFDIGPKETKILNDALRSKIEVLRDGKWKPE